MDNQIENGPDSGEPNFSSLEERTAQTLDRHGISLDTDFKDQHFLVSEEAINDLIEGADVSEEDEVLEIGPGIGQITERLAPKAKRVHAIEIDERFRPILDEVRTRQKNIEINYGDAISVPWPRADKLVANIPFSILEPLIGRIIQAKGIEQCALVVGRNYYLRCTDPRLTLSRTALLTNAFFNIELKRELERGEFYPPSREKAVVVALTRKSKRERDFGMTHLANRMLRHPNQKVWGVLADVINESYDPRRDDPRQIPTVESLGLPHFLLQKSLRQIDNTDINAVVQTLRRFDKSTRGRGRHNRGKR